MGFVGKMRKMIDRVSWAFTHVSGYIFIFIVFVVLANIVGRVLFNVPVRGTVEIVQLGMLLCAAIVMCRSGFEERHICVMLIVDVMPRRLKAAIIAFGKFVSIVIFIVISYLFCLQVPEAVKLNKVTDTFRFPYYYFYAVLAVAFAIGAIVFFYQFCASLSEALKGAPAEDSSNKSNDSGPNQY